jgi:hypothetical protein
MGRFMKAKTITVRVDADVWKTCKSLFPKESDPTISRLLYNNSLAKLEYALGQNIYDKRKKTFK